MGIFASNGRLEKDYPRDVQQVRDAIQKAAGDNGHHLGAISEDRNRFEISTKRTAMNWGTAVAITLSSSGTGARAVVDYDNVNGSPRALLDGRKNTRTVNTFLEQLEAVL